MLKLKSKCLMLGVKPLSLSKTCTYITQKEIILMQLYKLKTIGCKETIGCLGAVNNKKRLHFSGVPLISIALVVLEFQLRSFNSYNLSNRD